jgi:hypothetical protein
MMSNQNINSTSSKELEVVKIETIEEKPMAQKPTFYDSMANNPLQNRLDGTTSRYGLLRIVHIIKGSMQSYYDGSAVRNYAILEIPLSEMPNIKDYTRIVMQGWVQTVISRVELNSTSSEWQVYDPISSGYPLQGVSSVNQAFWVKDNTTKNRGIVFTMITYIDTGLSGSTNMWDYHVVFLEMPNP